jgi:hypothetical protein
MDGTIGMEEDEDVTRRKACEGTDIDSGGGCGGGLERGLDIKLNLRYSFPSARPPITPTKRE